MKSKTHVEKGQMKMDAPSAALASSATAVFEQLIDRQIEMNCCCCILRLLQFDSEVAHCTRVA
jgi:hypothetical protein